MADNHTWGEIFNLTEELRKIEEEVDKRLEETLAEDPHVIEQETVHYGAAAAAADRSENFRMRQSVPLFEPLGNTPPADDRNAADTPANAAGVMEAAANDASVADAPVDDTDARVRAAAAAWDESPVDDYVPPIAAEPESIAAGAPDQDMVNTETAEASARSAGNVIAFPGAEPASVEAEQESEQVEAAHGSADPESDHAEPASVNADTEPAAAVSEPTSGDPDDVTAEPLAEDPGHAAAEPTPEQSPRGSEGATSAILQDRKRILGILIAIIVVLAVVLGYRYYQDHARQQRQYAAAEALYQDGDYDAAAEAFAALRNYKDAAARVMDAQYAHASYLVDQNAYGDAIDYIDNLSAPTDAMLTLRTHAIYELAMLYYNDGDLENAAGELMTIEDAEVDGVKVADRLHEIRYQEAADALAVYDYETAEPILAALGDYEDAAVLLAQVQNAVDAVYTDVARDDNGKEIEGKTQYLWVHSVITPGAVKADSTADEQTAETNASAANAANDADAAETTGTDANDAETTAQSGSGMTAEEMAAYRALAGATDAVADEDVHVLMMHMDTTDAEMTYEEAEPIKTDTSEVITMDVSSYAAIDDSFGQSQTVFSPQTLQRSDTDYALSFEGSAAYAAKDRADDAVRMECKLADDGYWVKTRRVYAEMEDDRLVGVPRSQLRTWTRVTRESLADEVRQAFLNAME